MLSVCFLLHYTGRGDLFAGGMQNTPVPLAEAVAAAERMLHWRGQTTVVPFEHAAFVPLRAVAMREEPSTVVLVTDVTRITSQQLRAVLEALETEDCTRLQLVVKHAVNLHSHHATIKVTVVLWDLGRAPLRAVPACTLVLTYPLDHAHVPRHQRATEADLAWLARRRHPRAGHNWIILGRGFRLLPAPGPVGGGSPRCGSTTPLPSTWPSALVTWCDWATFLGGAHKKKRAQGCIDRQDGTAYYRVVVSAR
jgi:hypothetical protein